MKQHFLAWLTLCSVALDRLQYSLPRSLSFLTNTAMYSSFFKTLNECSESRF